MSASTSSRMLRNPRAPRRFSTAYSTIDRSAPSRRSSAAPSSATASLYSRARQSGGTVRTWYSSSEVNSESCTCTGSRPRSSASIPYSINSFTRSRTLPCLRPSAPKPTCLSTCAWCRSVKVPAQTKRMSFVSTCTKSCLFQCWVTLSGTKISRLPAPVRELPERRAILSISSMKMIPRSVASMEWPLLKSSSATITSTSFP